MKKLLLNILEFLNLKIKWAVCKIKFSNMEDFKGIPITYLPLSSPTRNYLMRGSKTTVESVLNSDLSQLSEVRNLSRKFIEEICSVLVVFGFYSEKLTGSKTLYEGLSPYEKTLVMAARIERVYRPNDSKSLITEDRCKEMERNKLDIINGYLRGDGPMSFQNSIVVPLLDYVPYLEEDADFEGEWKRNPTEEESGEPDEDSTIFKKMSEERDYKMDESLDPLVLEMIELKKKGSGEYFSNARAIKNILQEVVKNQEKRLYSKIKENIEVEEEELNSIKEEDLLLTMKEMEEVQALESKTEKRVGF